ncbi:hypothetical protein ACE2AJ_10925 [Aquihabitans daechungensis]|uniref:hypothetical protein n=1 Tax=Aquihabitans daechungensis TaxID=1052257 RepID=UPI003BA1FBCB
MDEEQAVGASLDARIRMRLRGAMRDRDRSAVTALRMALGAIDNGSAVPDDDRTQSERIAAAAEATDVARRELSETETRDIVCAEVRELEGAAAEYREHGQEDAAADADHQAAVLREVLAATDDD